MVPSLLSPKNLMGAGGNLESFFSYFCLCLRPRTQQILVRGLARVHARQVLSGRPAKDVCISLEESASEQGLARTVIKFFTVAESCSSRSSVSSTEVQVVLLRWISACGFWLEDGDSERAKKWTERTSSDCQFAYNR